MERDGKFYGRGACDTKGFIAAALAAIEETDLSKLARPLALVLTADEEVGCLGAKRLAESRPFRVRHAVVGEPTSLRPIRAGKGYCLADVRVRGREGHSAYPSTGASAITRAARLITRIERVAEELKRDAHEAFDPPHTTVNVGLVEGGTAKNIIAGECRFTLEWRPVPGQRPERVAELVRREIETLRAEDEDFDCELSVTRLDGGMETAACAPKRLRGVRWARSLSARKRRSWPSWARTRSSSAPATYASRTARASSSPPPNLATRSPSCAA